MAGEVTPEMIQSVFAGMNPEEQRQLLTVLRMNVAPPVNQNGPQAPPQPAPQPSAATLPPDLGPSPQPQQDLSVADILKSAVGWKGLPSAPDPYRPEPEIPPTDFGPTMAAMPNEELAFKGLGGFDEEKNMSPGQIALVLSEIEKRQQLGQFPARPPSAMGQRLTSIFGQR